MSKLSIVGGLYRESCIWPNWDQVLGSGGRAAEAAAAHIDKVKFYAYATPDAEAVFENRAKLSGFKFHPTPTRQKLSFSYIHPLSPPLIEPAPSVLKQEAPIEVEADAVLRFGMLEGDAKVTAKRCVYDPQSAFAAIPFGKNGSTADELAIVANKKEIVSLAGGGADPIEAAKKLLSGNVTVVVVKGGVGGADVVQQSKENKIPAFQTSNVFKVGSGDIFATMFAIHWAVNGADPVDAALIASRAVAHYVESMSLQIPGPSAADANMIPITADGSGRVFIAGSFSSMGQRWVVDEARRCLKELGLTVYSPLHDIGEGQGAQHSIPDIALLEASDRVFAVLDGIDNRALFAIGWASKKNIPVYLFAQSSSEEDLRMARGAEACRIFDDFASAIYHTAWKA